MQESRLLGNFVLDGAVLSEAEKHEILAALQSISSTIEAQNSVVLDKLSALFDVDTESWLPVIYYPALKIRPQIRKSFRTEN